MLIANLGYRCVKYSLMIIVLLHHSLSTRCSQRRDFKSFLAHLLRRHYLSLILLMGGRVVCSSGFCRWGDLCLSICLTIVMGQTRVGFRYIDVRGHLDLLACCHQALTILRLHSCHSWPVAFVPWQEIFIFRGAIEQSDSVRKSRHANFEMIWGGVPLKFPVMIDYLSIAHLGPCLCG